MTAIATIITSRFTAHATDSFITRRTDEGNFDVIGTQETKIVRVARFRGAICYWGVATHGEWSTLSWLRARAANASAYSTAEDFARTLAADLTRALRFRSFANPLQRGIGIHFSSYERVNDYWVPELFHIRNWQNVEYSEVQDEIEVSRETYGASQGIERSEADGDSARRLAVHNALQGGMMLIFNNGDPQLFNPIAHSVLSAVETIRQRGDLRDLSDPTTHLDFVRRPIEVCRGSSPTSRGQAGELLAEGHTIWQSIRPVTCTPGPVTNT